MRGSVYYQSSQLVKQIFQEGLKKEDDLVLQDVADIIIKYDAHTWTKFRELKISPAGKAYKRRLNMNWFEMYNKSKKFMKIDFATSKNEIVTTIFTSNNIHFLNEIGLKD